MAAFGSCDARPKKEKLPVFLVYLKMADTCGQVLLGSGLTVLSHPLMYIKVLIQVREVFVQTYEDYH